MQSIQLNSDQQHALEVCTTDPAPITIIQGKAGSGKSFLVKEILARLSNAVILTPTNMAKSVYRQAQTYHAFFYGEFDNLDEGFQDVPNYNPKHNIYFANRIADIQTIILDEISMVRADYMEMMNVVCQKARHCSQPFGGIKIICVGDMYQLPPVVDNEATLAYLNHEYGGIYYFNSHVIQRNVDKIRYCELTQSVRQKEDTTFEHILDDFRAGCDITKLLHDLDTVNTRVTTSIPQNVVTIAGSNAEVCTINRSKLNRLPGTEYCFPAQISIRLKGFNDKYKDIIGSAGMLQDATCENIEMPSQYETELVLKCGALVMFTSSNKKAGYANGDLGIVTDIDTKNQVISVCHKQTHVIHLIKRTFQYRYHMRYDKEKHSLCRVLPYVQKTTQYPLKVAYAFTVHKSQGQTYDQICIDLQSPFFASGQLYVALSRAKSLSGVFLTKPVSVGDIIVDPTIGEFFQRFNANYRNSNALQIPTSPLTGKLAQLYNMVIQKNNDSIAQFAMQRVCHLADYLVKLKSYKYAIIELNKLLDFATSRYVTSNVSAIITQIQQSISNCDNHYSVDDFSSIVDLFIQLYNRISISSRKVITDRIL